MLLDAARWFSKGRWASLPLNTVCLICVHSYNKRQVERTYNLSSLCVLPLTLARGVNKQMVVPPSS
jgi:hypothetical protein